MFLYCRQATSVKGCADTHIPRRQIWFLFVVVVAALPDLVVDQRELATSLAWDRVRVTRAGDKCVIDAGCLDVPRSSHDADIRTLLRFTTRIRNTGSSNAVAGRPSWSNKIWEYNTCNDNFQLADYATYKILRASDRAFVGDIETRGFYLRDDTCRDDTHKPHYTYEHQGITRGCSSAQESHLACQYVLIDHLWDDTEYILVVHINVNEVITESNYANNKAEVFFRPQSLRAYHDPRTWRFFGEMFGAALVVLGIVACVSPAPGGYHTVVAVALWCDVIGVIIYLGSETPDDASHRASIMARIGFFLALAIVLALFVIVRVRPIEAVHGPVLVVAALLVLHAIAEFAYTTGGEVHSASAASAAADVMVSYVGIVYGTRVGTQGLHVWIGVALVLYGLYSQLWASSFEEFFTPARLLKLCALVVAALGLSIVPRPPAHVRRAISYLVSICAPHGHSRAGIGTDNTGTCVDAHLMSCLLVSVLAKNKVTRMKASVESTLHGISLFGRVS